MPFATPPRPPTATTARAVMFGMGVGIPVLVAIATGHPRAGLFAGMGALLALFTDPRRSFALRSLGIFGVVAVMFVAALLGATLQGHHGAAMLVVLVIAFLAGLPKPCDPYLTVVGKLAGAAVIIASSGFSASLLDGISFVAGGLFTLIVAVVESRWRDRNDAGTSPLEELRAVWSGDHNPLFYAAALSGAVALAIALAHGLSAHFPGWVGLTVLFVMHPDDTTAVRMIAQRIGGTLAAVAVAGIVVHWISSPWALAMLAIACAAAMPKAMATNFFWTSAAYTLVLLLLLDIALLASGGAAPLVRWRFYDTVLGCAAVATTLYAIRIVRCWRGHRDHLDPPPLTRGTGTASPPSSGPDAKK